MTKHSQKSAAVQAEIPVDLRRDGILYLVNKVVFHPRGFSLAYDQDWHEFFLQGDGSESWMFAPDIEYQRFKAVKKMFKRAKKHNSK